MWNPNNNNNKLCCYLVVIYYYLATTLNLSHCQLLSVIVVTCISITVFRDLKFLFQFCSTSRASTLKIFAASLVLKKL